jgi:osmotically-inducible protein OsmY
MDHRDRDRRPQGMFGYEGEGFMRGGADYDDFARRGYGRDGDFSNDRDYNVGHDRPRHDAPPARGFRDVEAPRQSFRGRGPKNYQRSDDRIREDVCERLHLDDDVDASEIEVHVTNATVTLTGTVSDRWAKRRAEDLVEDVSGVQDVQNQLRIARPSATP